MRFARVDAAQLPATPGPHPAASPYDKGVGQALGVRAFGIYQIELPPGAQTVRHDHLDDRTEDVYAILSGSVSSSSTTKRCRSAPASSSRSRRTRRATSAPATAV